MITWRMGVISVLSAVLGWTLAEHHGFGFSVLVAFSSVCGPYLLGVSEMQELCGKRIDELMRRIA